MYDNQRIRAREALCTSKITREPLTQEQVENLAATWLGRETNLSMDYCASSAREFAAVLFGKPFSRTRR